MASLYKKRFYFKKFLLIFLIAALMLFLLIFFQKEIKYGFYIISSPIQKSLWFAGDKFSNFFNIFTDKNKLNTEVERLQNENRGLVAENSELKNLQKENEILRDMLEISPRKDLKLEIAQVISKNISQDFILIDKGERDGLKKDMAVITSKKILLGRINETYATFSKVILITDKKSSFDAKIQKDGKDIGGVAKGGGNSSLCLDLVPQNEELTKGDVILTSGLGGIFPEGLFVGEIKSAKKNDLEAFQKIDVAPGFVLQDINILFIIIGNK
jgi:rod shape-determining protein MreC